jgi:glyoxylase-like metal-dependent hydrolase (beta-lactamase superfamily II)/predicted ester cyclase
MAKTVADKTAEIARRYFDALAAKDLDAATACWQPGGIDEFVGSEELTAPDGIRTYFSGLFAAFPDFAFEIRDVTAAGARAAVRWRAEATFAGPGTFQGFAPNHAHVTFEGCDVVTVGAGLIVHNAAYVDTGAVARQLGFLPSAGSAAEQRLAQLANVRTKAIGAVHGVRTESIAPGVWVVRGGFPLKTFNVYLIEDEGGVTVFDAGIAAMGPALRAAAAQLGPVKRVVLGHADADHRGAAPVLGAPVYCHEGDRAAAESSATMRPYWDTSTLRGYARFFYARALPAWDGGAVTIEGTLAEGDQVAGFEVIELPGHAPGLIALFRRDDRLALISDCVYTLDIQTGAKGGPRIPHRAFDADVEQARASIRKLAELDPAVAWAGHAEPVTGDVAQQLRRAADAPA